MPLCLTRKEGEAVTLYVDGERLGKITVNEARDGTARVGFDLPRRIHLMREELERESEPATR
jgi:sRNA-binding carbon storage regulator CsrA